MQEEDTVTMTIDDSAAEAPLQGEEGGANRLYGVGPLFTPPTAEELAQQRDDNNRLTALDIAARQNEPYATTVDRAKAYYKFLSGDRSGE